MKPGHSDEIARCRPAVQPVRSVKINALARTSEAPAEHNPRDISTPSKATPTRGRRDSGKRGFVAVVRVGDCSVVKPDDHPIRFPRRGS